MAVFARWPKKVVVITRWPYYRGGRKAGFCCTSKQRFRHVQTLVRLTIIFLKQVAKKGVPVFVFSRTRQLGIFSIECPLYSAPRTKLICSPLLLACLLTGGLLRLKHNCISFFCLEHSYCLWSKIMIYFLISSLIYLNQRDFIKST